MIAGPSPLLLLLLSLKPDSLLRGFRQNISSRQRRRPLPFFYHTRSNPITTTTATTAKKNS